MSDLARRMTDALGSGPLAERLPVVAAPFFEERGADAAADRLDGPALVGLARALASQPKAAGFLSHRPGLFERIAAAEPDGLATRAQELLALPPPGDVEDLEGELDALRLLRREETCLAACLDLGGALPFPAVSDFLSTLAEVVTGRALTLARSVLGEADSDVPFSVIGMGKIAGCEFTYHSDLDLIFLFDGEADDIARVSRIAQRTISYLTTMTGAGIAYPVDTRLRPSGQQGMLVTSYAGFERYQLDQAETWEHIALLRARPIAGSIEPAQQLIDSIRRQVAGAGRSPWAYLQDLRTRVERERADETSEGVPIKTGRGGLMDVDFLATGGVLECGADTLPALPSVPAMLRGLGLGSAAEALLDDYLGLRVIEARCRWLRGRATESLDTDPEALALAADLVEPGLSGPALVDRVAAMRDRIRSGFERVMAGGSIRCLAED